MADGSMDRATVVNERKSVFASLATSFRQIERRNGDDSALGHRLIEGMSLIESRDARFMGGGGLGERAREGKGRDSRTGVEYENKRTHH